MPERDNISTEPKRVETFAKFFKNYMSVSAMVTAALPIPVTAFNLIPTYKAHTSLLSTYTSLFCFLLLGFIFYSRHQLARWMFPGMFEDSFPRFATRFLRFGVAVLPALLIVASLTCVFFYHSTLDRSVSYFIVVSNSTSVADLESSTIRDIQALRHPRQYFPTADRVLESVEDWEIPGSGMLMLLYLAIFLFAESAFILMAIKEYLQDLVKLTEMELIVGHRFPSKKRIKRT